MLRRIGIAPVTGIPLPFVSVGRRDDAGGPVPYVGADYPTAVAALVRRAVALGHRRLAYVGHGAGPESYADRMAGFRAAVREAGVAGRRLPVVYDGSGNLYFPWAGYVWSLEPDGDLRWSLFIGGTPTGPAVTPNGTMVFTKESSLVGVSMGGQKLWEYTFPSSALVWERQPAIGPDGTIYMGAQNGRIYALSSGGSLNWEQQYVFSDLGWGGGSYPDCTSDQPQSQPACVRPCRLECDRVRRQS